MVTNLCSGIGVIRLSVLKRIALLFMDIKTKKH